MFNPDRFPAPVTCNLLVAFADLSGFARIARTQTSAQTFAFIEEFSSRAAAIVESAGGYLVKVIGDALMIVFDEADLSDGVLALLELKDRTDAWLKTEGYHSRLAVKAHFGELTCGPLGHPGRRSLDILGETVNIAALLKTDSFALTPQVFRRLSPAVRARFKKHTPPVVYIDVRENHRD